MKLLALAVTLLSVANVFAGPKISVFVNEIAAVSKERKVTLVEAAKLLADEGVSGFDANFTDPKLADYAATVLKPVSLYGFVPFLDADNGRATSDRFVATAVRFGAKRIMCIPQYFTDAKPNEPEFLKTVEGLKYLVQVAKAADVTVTVEDFGFSGCACGYVSYLKRYLTEIPDLQFALDSGNLFYLNRGESILEMLAFAEGRIAHVHLKDLVIEGDKRVYRTLGLGKVENREVVRTLAARGYDGWFTLENTVGDDMLEDVARQIAVVRFWFKTRRSATIEIKEK